MIQVFKCVSGSLLEGTRVTLERLHVCEDIPEAQGYIRSDSFLSQHANPGQEIVLVDERQIFVLTPSTITGSVRFSDLRSTAQQ